MPRNETKTARRARPERSASGVSTALPSLVSLLARAARPSDLLPHLHQHAIDRTGGACSMLFRHNPRTGALQATSGYGLEVLRTDPWLPEPDEALLVNAAFEARHPLLVTDAARQAPDLFSRIGAAAAILVPLVHGAERVGMLAIGLNAPADRIEPGVQEVGDAFLAAVELFHLRQNSELQRDVRRLLD